MESQHGPPDDVSERMNTSIASVNHPFHEMSITPKTMTSAAVNEAGDQGRTMSTSSRKGSVADDGPLNQEMIGSSGSVAPTTLSSANTHNKTPSSASQHYNSFRSHGHNRNRSQSSITSPSAYGHGHRASITSDSGIAPRTVPPPSPRHQAQSQPPMLDLLHRPPTMGQANPRFHGRNWKSIKIGEILGLDQDRISQTPGRQDPSLASSDDPSTREVKGNVEIVDMDCGIEEATEYLTESAHSVLLIQDKTATAVTSGPNIAATFDYRDLTQYLLFAIGQLHPANDEQLKHFQHLARQAQDKQKSPRLRDTKRLGKAEEVIMLSHDANLNTAVELFGGGVHRLVILKDGGRQVAGVLTQLHLLKFLWEQGSCFPVIDQLYSKELQELGIGTQSPISVNGDRPLKEALALMNNEAISSLAVVDNQFNVVGNISSHDVKLLTRSSSAPLLDNTCIHFVSIILSTRGMMDGKDSFPVFYVNPQSSLAHTVAKLVATDSHRMWIVEGSTPSTPASQISAPGTPKFASAVSPIASRQPHSPPQRAQAASTPQTSLASGSGDHDAHVTSSIATHMSSTPPLAQHTSNSSPISIAQPPAPQPPHMTSSLPQAHPPFIPVSASSSVSASALPGQHISGRLTGLVSLSDILNLFARATGLHPDNIEEARSRRRGSSASSGVGVHTSAAF